VTALEMLADQTENKTLKEAILNVHDNVEKGDSFASAMKKESIFPQLLINMTEAGEASGNLEKSMEGMANHFESDARLKGIVKKALMYPCVLITVMIAVVVVLLVVVIPQFQSMFDQIGGELPAFTVAVVAFSTFLQTRWYIVIAIIVAIVVAFKMVNSTPEGQRKIARFLLKVPVFGVLIQKQNCARFASTLSTLVGAGMGMVESIEITGKTLDNILYREAVLEAAVQVQRGVALSVPLKACKLFPPMILQMIAIGEETGNLEEMLNNSAVYYDEEVQNTTEQLTTLMEPFILICMAGVVCLLIAAIYGPMMTMYQQLGDMT
jgi:type IV pilus assembly protein PilC